MNILNDIVEAELSFHKLEKEVCALLRKKVDKNTCIVHRKIYLSVDGVWTVISENGPKTIPTKPHIHELLTEFACHKMGGKNLDYLKLKDENAWLALWAELFVLLKDEKEFLESYLSE